MGSSVKYPGTVTSVTSSAAAWSNPTNIGANDGSYASCAGAATYGKETLACTNFSFSIPTDATITGILVSFEGRTTDTTSTDVYALQLIKAGSTVGYSFYGNMSTSDSVLTGGSYINLWGTTWTPSDINSSTFGVQLVQHQGVVTSTWYVDYLTITVYYSCPAVTITTTDLPDGDINVAYSQTLAGTITTGTWSLASGTLPTGVSLTAATGVLSGTPSASGTYTFTIRLTSACDTSLYDDQYYVVTIACPTITISTTSLADGVTTEAYSQSLAATGGTVTWSVISGALPDGLSLTAATGNIAGTPTVANTFSFTVRATSTLATCTGSIDDQALSITIVAYTTVTGTAETIASVTETGAVTSQTYSSEIADNNRMYILNLRTGAFTYSDDAPFTSMLWSSNTNTLRASRIDNGNICTVDSGTSFDGTGIASSFRTGYFDFDKEGMKRLRALFSEVKSDGSLNLTVRTEQDTTGISFVIDPDTTDDVAYNMVQTALSRDIRGQYVSLEISNSGDAGWTARTAADTKLWYSIAYGDGLFVAIASNGLSAANMVMTSVDGITWTARTAADTTAWQSVTYGAGLFVAVGSAGGGTSFVMTSTDGITWTARTAAAQNQWRSVTYGNGLFVAVADSGTNRVMTSTNGITWTARSATEANPWWSVCYGNGLFVAVSYDGTNRVMTSPDGITWTARSAAEANQWFAVTYGNGLFVAVANTGTNRVMTSPDGITWTARSAAEANEWVSVCYGDGLFVAVSVTGTNRSMTSTDGITWTALATPEPNLWYSVNYGNGVFVAVANNGATRVMTMPRISCQNFWLGKLKLSGIQRGVRMGVEK